jgi:hypothetical protein
MKEDNFKNYAFLLINHTTKNAEREQELLNLAPHYQEIARFPDERKRKFIVIYQRLDVP